MSGEREKASILILGGTGFIGRHLVEYLIENDLVSKIRVVDKVPPQIAWLNSRHQEIFADARVEFKSANLINPSSCESAFADGDGAFDYVVNLAAETRYGQSESVYREGIVKLSVNCAKAAEKCRVKRYVEMSSAFMFSTGKRPSRESDKAHPVTSSARLKLSVEEELSRMSRLNYIVLRPAIVYGTGDRCQITPRLLIGGIYKYLGEMMKIFWDKDMKLNTVHVNDVCRAIWHLILHGQNRDIYNVVDKGDTTLGKVSDLISDIFNINHDYLGNFLSTLANKTDLSGLVEEINEKHLHPWAELCARDAIANTPLNPYIDAEMLLRKHVYLDGSKLESTGFVYAIPELRKEALEEVLQDYARMGLFPPSLLA